MRKSGFLLTMVLVLILGVTMTVKVSAAEHEAKNRKDRSLLEGEYLEEVQQILLEKGCKNAGVTLTYVTDTEGDLEYTLTIHHVKLEKMENCEYTLLKARIEEKARKMLASDICLKQI